MQAVSECPLRRQAGILFHSQTPIPVPDKKHQNITKYIPFLAYGAHPKNFHSWSHRPGRVSESEFSDIFENNMFLLIFLFEVVFIFGVLVIFWVVLIFGLSSYLGSPYFLGTSSFLGLFTFLLSSSFGGYLHFRVAFIFGLGLSSRLGSSSFQGNLNF